MRWILRIVGGLFLLVVIAVAGLTAVYLANREQITDLAKPDHIDRAVATASPELIEKASARLMRMREEQSFPSVSIAVASGGQIVWAEAAGYADLAAKRPATTQTQYSIGSTSKPLTASLVVRLADQGVIDLDKDIRTYAPSFPQKPYVVTARELLSHQGGIRHYGFDPTAAAKLLEEAGWTPGADSIRRNAAGQKLSLELVTTAGDRARELVQQVLQANWRAVGIEVRLKAEPARVLFGETITKRKFQMALFAWLSSPENVPRTTLHSSMIPSADNAWDGQNYTGFSSPEMDALIDRLEVELDPAARTKLWRRLQEITADELPAVPLWFRAQAFIYPKWLTGVVPTGNQFPTTLWVEDWKVGE